MTIPILLEHDTMRVLGTLTGAGNGMLVEFRPGSNVTKEMMFDIFGGAGFRVTECYYSNQPDVMHIKKAWINEFSLCVQPRAPDKSAKITEALRTIAFGTPLDECLNRDADGLEDYTNCPPSLLTVRRWLNIAKMAVTKRD